MRNHRHQMMMTFRSEFVEPDLLMECKFREVTERYMTDATDDAQEQEEFWAELKYKHKRGECDEDCPFCNPAFEPLFDFQGAVEP